MRLGKDITITRISLPPRTAKIHSPSAPSMKMCVSGISPCTGALWAFLAAVPLGLRAEEVPPIYVAFEAPEYTPGSLDGQQGWKVEQGKADIVLGGAHGGEQCLRLLAGDPFAQARLRLEGIRPEGSVSFIDFRVKPVASPKDPQGELLEVDGARIGFFLDEDAAAPNRGSFWVFDARAEGGGDWIKASKSFEVAVPAGESPSWIRITIRQDFTRQAWDCWIEGSMVAANLGFQEPHVAHTENYIIMGDVVEHVFLDDLVITPSNPLGKDSDSDGVPDDIEVRLGTQPFFDDRDEDADGDGMSNLAAFVASSLNHTPIVGASQHKIPTTPDFSRPSGFAGTPFLLEISKAAAGGTVLYTIDGSDPRQKIRQAARYDAPIPIGATSVVRAVHVDASGRMSPTATAAWVFPDSVVDQIRPTGVPQNLRDIGRSASVPWDYPLPVEMRTRRQAESTWPTAESVASALRSAPVLVLAADEAALFGFPDGIYHTPGSHARTTTAPAALTAFHLDGGAESLSAPDVVISISGDSSRYHDVTIKHSFRVRFPESAPLAVDRLLGADLPPARQLLLRHPTQDSWTVGAQWAGRRVAAHYFNDALAAETLRSMNHPALSRRWVHLFLNQTYWGVYEAIEQWNPGAAVTSLIEADEAGKTRAIFGSAKDWEALIDQAYRLASETTQRAVVETEWNPIRSHIDEVGLIHYILVNSWMANSDWPRRNYMILESGSRFSFLPWDAEMCLGVETEVTADPAEVVFSTGGGPAGLFSALCASAEFRQLVRSCLLELTGEGGRLAPAAWAARLATVSSVEEILPAEAARWGCWLNESIDHAAVWRTELNRLTLKWIPVRSDVLAAAFAARLDGMDAQHALLHDAFTRRPPPNPPLPFDYVIHSASTDTDGDGLPDEWELAHGLDSTDPADAAGDTDSDGLSAISEFLLKTNPRAANERHHVDAETFIFGRPDRPIVRHGRIVDSKAAIDIKLDALQLHDQPIGDTSGN